jgi:hypothetical protein
VSRLAVLSARVGTGGVSGLLEATTVVVAAAWGGRAAGAGLGDRGGADGALVVGIGVDGCPVSAGKPARPIESAVAIGRASVDSAAAAVSVPRGAFSSSDLAHDVAKLHATRTEYTPGSLYDDGGSITLQRVTGRATSGRLR